MGSVWPVSSREGRSTRSTIYTVRAMNAVVAPRDDNARRAFQKGLDKYLSTYDSSQALATDLIQRQQHPIEVLILLCARLDALASDARGDDVSNKRAFCRFLTDYGGHRKLFDAVSIPDLYYELGYYRWRLEGTIPAPGRLHRFTDLDDPLLHLIEDSGLPLTLKEIGRLLDTLTRILAQHFHAQARQVASKPRTASAARLQSLIEDGAKRSKLRGVASRLPNALLPLISKTRLSSILYERFRCESIHGATIRIDAKRFFAESDVYWKPIYPIYAGRKYELVEFPGQFLLNCLRACIGTYRAHLLAKGRVPHAIYFHGFDDLWSTLDFLDADSIPGGASVPLKL